MTIITKAEKITAWQDANPGARITEAILREILNLETLARAGLRGADLTGTDLTGADLRGADLRDADLYDANLSDANLSDAGLTGANLTGAGLRGADLTGTDLTGANLRDAGLYGANLTGTGLYGANLTGTDLTGANLYGSLSGILTVRAGDSGDGYLKPTPDGWRICIGCWHEKTLEDLDDLIHNRTTWPEAKGNERARRRPMLIAVKSLCEAWIGQQPDTIITDLNKKWNTK